MLSWAHGTTGLADVCAPSLEPDGAGIDLARAVPRARAWSSSPPTTRASARPDCTRTSPARARVGAPSTSSVPPATSRTSPSAGDQVLLWGHSQGGHAVLFANQIAPTWAPELDIVGTVAGAPPSQLPLISARPAEQPVQALHRHGRGRVERGVPRRRPRPRDAPEGQDLLPVMDEGCSEEIAEAFTDLSYEELVVADPATVEPWATLLVENDPGYVVGESPILIIHGEEDEQIPVVSSQLLLDRMCGIGQVVERRTYPGQMPRRGHRAVLRRHADLDARTGWRASRAPDVVPGRVTEGQLDR